MRYTVHPWLRRWIKPDYGCAPCDPDGLVAFGEIEAAIADALGDDYQHALEALRCNADNWDNDDWLFTDAFQAPYSVEDELNLFSLARKPGGWNPDGRTKTRRRHL